MNHSKRQTTEEIKKLAFIKKLLESHPFVVSKYMQSPFVQIASSYVFPYIKAALPAVERKYIDLPDGSKLAADGFFFPDRATHSTIVILTGFEGYLDERTSGLALSLLAKGYRAGFNVIHLKQRAEGDTVKMAKGLAYIPEDLPIAFAQIADWCVSKFYVVGYSAGGYNMLFALGTLGNKAGEFIKGAVAISIPVATFSTWEHVEKSPFFNWVLLRGYKKLVERRAAIDPPGTWDLSALKAIKTKREWAEKYLPHWGYTEQYKTLEELNSRTDVLSVISNVQIPTLLIHSADDPVSPITSVMQPEFQQNPYIVPLFTKYGGHCSFVMSKKLYGDPDRYWAHNRIMEFIQLLQKTR